MNKYKVGDKVVMKIISADQDEIKKYSVSGVNDNWRWCLPQNLLERYTEPLSTYTEPLERKNENKQKQIEKLVDKLHRQAAEITRLLRENKELKNEKQELTRERNQLMGRCGGLSAAKIKAFNNGRLAGQNEAWELVRKIFDMETNDIEDIFIKEDAWNLGTVLNNYTYQEAVAKVAEWEKAKEEIKVGDVVSREGVYGVVKSVSDDWLNGITASGISFQWLKRKCTKTGRHIDVDSFLKQIGEEGDEK